MSIDWSILATAFLEALLPWLLLAIGAGVIVIFMKKLLGRLFRR